MGWLRLVLLALGVGLLIGLVVGHDPAAVFASLGQLSWRFVVILLFPAIPVMIFDTLGWRYAFLRDRVPFVALLRTRLVGEAFNLVTPTAALGGEGVKAWLLRDRLPLDESVPSVIIAKTTITLAQGVFLLLGIAVASLGFGRSPLLLGMQWLLGLEVLALVAFIVVQTRGVVGWSVGQLERLGVRPEGAAPTAARVDRTLRTFYRHTPRRLTLSIAFHLVAWLLGAVESYLILKFLGIPVSLADRDGDRGVRHRRALRDLPRPGQPRRPGGRLRRHVRRARAQRGRRRGVRPGAAPARARVDRGRSRALRGRPAADDRRVLAARLTSVGRPLGRGPDGPAPRA